MKIEYAANSLKELGHPIRLSIFKLLVKAGSEGLPVGSIQEKLAIPNSTLSHHIAKLVSVDLINQQRDGRTLYCIPQFEKLNQLIQFLMEECCIDQNDGKC
jgi:DNA-binding transcriptional ArsR family regulator